MGFWCFWDFVVLRFWGFSVNLRKNQSQRYGSKMRNKEEKMKFFFFQVNSVTRKNFKNCFKKIHIFSWKFQKFSSSTGLKYQTRKTFGASGHQTWRLKEPFGHPTGAPFGDSPGSLFRDATGEKVEKWLVSKSLRTRDPSERESKTVDLNILNYYFVNYLHLCKKNATICKSRKNLVFLMIFWILSKGTYPLIILFSYENIFSIFVSKNSRESWAHLK